MLDCIKVEIWICSSRYRVNEKIFFDHIHLLRHNPKMMKPLSLLLLLPLSIHTLCYEVHFEGVDDPAALRALKDASQLLSLQDRPPASVNGLRYRISSDLPEMLKVLHAFAYYDASITTDLETDKQPYQVYLFIQTGAQYKLSSYEVYQGDCRHLAEIAECSRFSPEQLGLKLGQGALATDIVNAELNVLTELAKCGYPLAQIDKRRVEVDMAAKTVQAASCIQEGPIAYFGPASFFGLNKIRPELIESKIDWKEGERYDTDKITATQERLLKSELFSSVYITHGDELDQEGELPIKFRITESSHQRVAVGFSYATIDGPGGVFSWTHRNIGGMGDILSTKAEVSKRFAIGNIIYKKPDFPYFNQTYRALGEISREHIHPYRAFMYRGANYLDWKINSKCTFSAGLKVEHIHISDSASNGTYLVMGLPIFFQFFDADQVLDPSQGCVITYSNTPYQSLFHGGQQFDKQRATGNFYLPLHPSKRLILALRVQIGSIAGTAQENIPLSKLFLGGSEDDLRGYRYKTVSPLNANREPLGGRSAIFSTAELRMKVTKTVGVVPFADFGVVSLSQLPQFTEKWFKSVGIGLRYFAFFGPLRFDVGFPLDRRKGIDPHFQIYASVGQAF